MHDPEDKDNNLNSVLDFVLVQIFIADKTFDWVYTMAVPFLGWKKILLNYRWFKFWHSGGIWDSDPIGRQIETRCSLKSVPAQSIIWFLNEKVLYSELSSFSRNVYYCTRFKPFEVKILSSHLCIAEHALAIPKKL